MTGNTVKQKSREEGDFYVVLFPSVSHAMKSEKILKEKGIPFKLIPVPKSISSDCGVCIRFTSENRTAVQGALSTAVDDFRVEKLS